MDLFLHQVCWCSDKTVKRVRLHLGNQHVKLKTNERLTKIRNAHLISNVDFKRLGGKGSAIFKIGLHTHQNPCTGLSVATGKHTDRVGSVVQTFTCLETRFLRLSTLLIKRGEIQGSLRSCPKEYIPEFPFVNRSLLPAKSTY